MNRVVDNQIIESIGRKQDPPPWGFLDTTNTVAVLLIAVVLIGTVIASFIAENATNPSQFVLMVGWSIGCLITILFVYVTRRRTPENIAAMRMGTNNTRLPLVILLSIAVAITVNLIVASFSQHLRSSPELFGIEQANMLQLLVAFVFMVILQPVAEELVFRGVLQPKLRVLIGGWGGLVVTSIVYALFHLIIYGSNLTEVVGPWYIFVMPLILGFYAGIVRIYTDSTTMAIVAHGSMGLFFWLSLLVLGG